MGKSWDEESGYGGPVRHLVGNSTTQNGSRFRLWACGVVTLVILVTSITLVAVSLKKLNSTEYGLQYNVHKKELDDAAKAGGLYSGPPGFEFIKFPSTYITTNLDGGTCVSKDGLQVKFSVTFQYQMPKEWLLPAVLKFRNYDRWSEVVEAAGNSAVHHSCSEFSVSNFQNRRGIIQATMEDNLRLKLEGEGESGEGGVYARAVSLQLRNVELPELYNNAVAEKQAAAEDISLAKNQRTQETTRARTQLLAAREEARKILDTATNEANITLTEANLEAEEINFAFQTEADVLVGVKSTLNLTTEGVLAYMANQLVSEVPNLKVSAAEPARLSRKEEL